MISLFDYQEKAISELKTGSILKGGVGSGKTITSLAYFYNVECGGSVTKKLYVITTAKKRDTHDWENEASNYGLTPIVDSWNNISKYVEVKGAFFIFDEQRVVGYGKWVKSFLKIAKNNNWILLSATPGDRWIEYVPVFIANGFYKNKTEFTREHVVYNTFTNYPKIDRYVGEGKLYKLKSKIIVEMDYTSKINKHIVKMVCPFDSDKFDVVYEKRWNPFKDRPITNAAEACYALRQVVNSDQSRLDAVLGLSKKHKKLIVFYNFDYELDILRKLNDILPIPIAEYNGHLHEPIPNADSWIYLAQYVSAAEGWNCTETNAVILYSRNYSYKITTQAMGRIDRQNSPFANLYYYFLTSNSKIDQAIGKAYGEKKNFNEAKFIKKGLA